MTIHLTIWWLWWALIGIYVAGVLTGMIMSILADSLNWWVRPVILVWPAWVAGITLWHLARFMTGRE